MGLPNLRGCVTLQGRSAPGVMSKAMGKYRDSKRWIYFSKVISFQNNMIPNTQGYQEEHLGIGDRETWTRLMLHSMRIQPKSWGSFSLLPTQIKVRGYHISSRGVNCQHLPFPPSRLISQKVRLE